MRFHPVLSILPLALLAAAPAPAAQESDAPVVDPASHSLEDIIACKLPDVPTWNGFALWFYDNEDARRHYGMVPVKGGNPFLSEYRLAAPITVFGRTTDRVAFSSSGLMAVLSGVTPQALAKELDVPPVIDAPGKFMGERVVTEAAFDGGSEAFQGTMRISLNVSTVTTHPGKVLAGCSYAIDMKE